MTRFIVILLLGTLVVSCSPKTRFVWGNYENSLYRYYKNPETRDQYKASLEKAVEKGQSEGKLAPGLMAELGYLALEDGESTVAVNYFEQEMQAFPESRPFMQKVILRIKGQDESTDDQELVS
jgi:hypothetical protein